MKTTQLLSDAAQLDRKRFDLDMESLTHDSHLIQMYIGRLADPDSLEEQQPEYAQNETRSIKPEFLVLLGICTHLSCSPKFHPEVVATTFDSTWTGGFYCPCHGSKFDLAGRVFSGVPAPTNLEVPPHYFESDAVLVIGEDEGVA